MMQCKDIDERMVDFLYQELEGTVLEEWNAHVAGCARCGAEIQSLQRTRQALRALPEAEPSPAVTTRLLHEAGKRAAKTKAAEGGILDWLHRLVGPVIAHPAWAAAASLLIVVGVAGFLSMRGKVSEHAAIDRPTAAVHEEAAPIRDFKADKPADPAAAAPATTVVTSPTGAELAEKVGEVRAPGSPPAVVSRPPAKKARDDLSSFADADRRGRTASALEDESLKGSRAAANERAKLERSVDDLGGKPAAPPPAAAEPQAPAEREVGGYDAPADKPQEQTAAGPRLDEESRKEAKDLRSNAAPAKPRPSPASAPEPAPAQPAASPPPPPPPAPKSSYPQSESVAGGAGKGDAAEAPPVLAKSKAKEPPEQELLRLSQKQASTGLCDEALGTRQKIQRMNPEFYRKRVAGDPSYKTCEEQSRRKQAPARQKTQDAFEADGEKQAPAVSK
jgi:hypothetical protein